MTYYGTDSMDDMDVAKIKVLLPNTIRYTC